MKRALGLDFAKQALIAFLCLSFTHWVVNLSSYVREKTAPTRASSRFITPRLTRPLPPGRRASAATPRRCRTAT